MQCTEVRFSSFFSGGFITAIVVNPPERQLAKRTSVHCTAAKLPKYVAALVVTYLNTCPVLMPTYSFRRNAYFKAWFFN